MYQRIGRPLRKTTSMALRVRARTPQTEDSPRVLEPLRKVRIVRLARRSMTATRSIPSGAAARRAAGVQLVLAGGRELTSDLVAPSSSRHTTTSWSNKARDLFSSRPVKSADQLADLARDRGVQASCLRPLNRHRLQSLSVLPGRVRRGVAALMTGLFTVRSIPQRSSARSVIVFGAAPSITERFRGHMLAAYSRSVDLWSAHVGSRKSSLMYQSRSGGNLTSAVPAPLGHSSSRAAARSRSWARDGENSTRLLARLSGEFAVRDTARTGSRPGIVYPANSRRPR